MEKFEEFNKELASWVNETFPTKTKESIALHLKEEVDELLKSHNEEEIADCFMLVLDYANHLNIDILEAAKKKLKICKNRKWHEPDKDNVVRHIK